jgi:hypothetical protein
MTSNGETTKTKVVAFEKLCNFVVDNLSFELYFLNYAFSILSLFMLMDMLAWAGNKTAG